MDFMDYGHDAHKIAEFMGTMGNAHTFNFSLYRFCKKVLPQNKKSNNTLMQNQHSSQLPPKFYQDQYSSYQHSSHQSHDEHEP